MPAASAGREGGKKSNAQFPMPTARYQTRIKSHDSSCFFVYCDLQFEFYPRPEHSGRGLGFAFFDIWNFRLVRVRGFTKLTGAGGKMKKIRRRKCKDSI